MRSRRGSGTRNALGYQRAFQFDADGQHDPREIAALEAELEAGADMVIGSRFGEGSVEYRVGPVRRAAMHLLRWSVNRLSRQKFSDTSSGFRGFDARVLHYFAERLSRWSSWTRPSRCCSPVTRASA